MGLDLKDRSPAVQDAIWSTSVQYPPAGAKNVFKRSLKDQDISKLTDKEIIEKVYDYKYDTVEKHFSSSSSQWKGVRDRFKNEKTDLLKLCD